MIYSRSNSPDILQYRHQVDTQFIIIITITIIINASSITCSRGS